MQSKLILILQLILERDTVQLIFSTDYYEVEITLEGQ